MPHSEELKTLMEEALASMPLREAGVKTGVAHAIIWDMLKEGKIPRRETFVLIVNGLQVNPDLRDRLFAAVGHVDTGANRPGNEERPLSRDEADLLIHGFSELREPDRALVLELIGRLRRSEPEKKGGVG